MWSYRVSASVYIFPSSDSSPLLYFTEEENTGWKWKGNLSKAKQIVRFHRVIKSWNCKKIYISPELLSAEKLLTQGYTLLPRSRLHQRLQNSPSPPTSFGTTQRTIPAPQQPTGSAEASIKLHHQFNISIPAPCILYPHRCYSWGTC